MFAVICRVEGESPNFRKFAFRVRSHHRTACEKARPRTVLLFRLSYYRRLTHVLCPRAFIVGLPKESYDTRYKVYKNHNDVLRSNLQTSQEQIGRRSVSYLRTDTIVIGAPGALYQHLTQVVVDPGLSLVIDANKE